jgi:hypothetical protein
LTATTVAEYATPLVRPATVVDVVVPTWDTRLPGITVTT